MLLCAFCSEPRPWVEFALVNVLQQSLRSLMPQKQKIQKFQKTRHSIRKMKTLHCSWDFQWRCILVNVNSNRASFPSPSLEFWMWSNLLCIRNQSKFNVKWKADNRNRDERLKTTTCDLRDFGSKFAFRHAILHYPAHYQDSRRAEPRRPPWTHFCKCTHSSKKNFPDRTNHKHETQWTKRTKYLSCIKYSCAALLFMDKSCSNFLLLLAVQRTQARTYNNPGIRKVFSPSRLASLEKLTQAFNENAFNGLWPLRVILSPVRGRHITYSNFEVECCCCECATNFYVNRQQIMSKAKRKSTGILSQSPSNNRIILKPMNVV